MSPGPVDPPTLETGLRDQGFARIPALLDAAACRDLAQRFDDDGAFRSRVVMERHGFGRGRYAYFARPLPPLVESLRRDLYEALAPIANRMMETLGDPLRYPDALDGFLARCHQAGQGRPTPLLLRYGPGDYNRLHRDLYGPLLFPLQVTVLLSRPGRDFRGGEFLLLENRARQQARGRVVALAQGDAVVFPVDVFPTEGRRGPVRARMRHGVSELLDGQRFALGLIFHDAA